MHGRLDHGKAQLLTRTGLDWTHKYPSIAAALSALPLQQAYFKGNFAASARMGKPHSA
jgi:bifunctional non-homologous end joining protein LigD